jgi:hypothetical protein
VKMPSTKALIAKTCVIRSYFLISFSISAQRSCRAVRLRSESNCGEYIVQRFCAELATDVSWRLLDPLLPAEEITARLDHLLQLPTTHRMPNLLIVGATNNGKTALVYRNTKPGEEPAGGQPGSVRYSVPPPGPRARG